jgi:hypothetical protein
LVRRSSGHQAIAAHESSGEVSRNGMAGGDLPGVIEYVNLKPGYREKDPCGKRQ